MICTGSSYDAEQCSVNFSGVLGAQAGATLSPPPTMALWRGGPALQSAQPAVFTGARSPAPFRRPTQQEQHRRRRPYPKQKRAMARAAECRINRKIWVELHISWGGRGLKSERVGARGWPHAPMPGPLESTGTGSCALSTQLGLRQGPQWGVRRREPPL